MTDITNFKNRMIAEGKVDFDKTYGYQCVDLIREYLYSEYGMGNSAGGVGYAINYWTNTPQAILEKFDRIETTNVRNGDIVILRTVGHSDFAIPGHIVIGTGGLTDANFEALEQNGSTGGGSGVGPDAIRTRWIDRSRIAGVLRPKDATPPPAPAAAYTVEVITEKKVQLEKYPTMEWDLNKREWQGFNENPITHNGGEVVTIRAVARHNLGGIYLMQDPNVARGFNQVDVKDYAEPAPQPPAPENYATHYTYEMLVRPAELQTKLDQTNEWDLNFDDYKNARPRVVHPKGTKFVAYAKATRNDLGHEVYFLTEEQFKTAPQSASGINTVDLEPWVEPVVDNPVTEPSNPLPTGEGEQIPVHVTPTDPNKWKESFTSMAAGQYTATKDVVVKDLEQLKPDAMLHKSQNVGAAGSFTKDNVIYLRTKKGVENNTWYGVPMDAVSLETLDEDGDIFNLEDIKLSDELNKAVKHLSVRKRLIIRWATIAGWLESLFSRKKNKKEK